MNNKLVKLELLDFLRGTLAFLVMIYHFNLWNGNKTNFLNFIGIYGVESFFILSGVVLTYTYSKNKLDIFSYFMKRFYHNNNKSSNNTYRKNKRRIYS